MKFISPTKGVMSLGEVMADINEFISFAPEAKYRLIVGTDSQVRNKTIFVTAVIIHRVGKGARYYYVRRVQRAIESLRQRIYYETSLSLEIAAKITGLLAASQVEMSPEIHLDIGDKGETRTMIKEIVGMVIGSGYSARIKPYSYGATSVADKHTKGL